MRDTYRFLSSFTLIMVFMVPTAAHAQQWSGIIAPSRAIDWSNAGAGPIPARTTICATLSPGATGSQINSAIQSCPAGDTVFLSAGTYSIGGLTFNNKSNVTLRGAGADQTFLVFTGANSCQGLQADICVNSLDTNWKGGPSNVANWTAGYAAGTTVITLSATANLRVGWPLVLDQLDDTVDSGDIYECSGTSCAKTGDGGGPRPGRGEQQIVTVTAINGNQVTISPGLYMPNWSAAKTPQAWWATSPIFNAGIENMSLDHTLVITGINGIAFFNCNGCWVKGVRSMKPNRSHVHAENCNHITIRDSYLWENQSHASVSYGLDFIPCFDCLVENNIFEATTAPRVRNGGAGGTVMGYNFDVNNAYYVLTWLNVSDSSHAVGADFTLLEGNESAQFYADVEHGSNQFNTAFRNRYNGFQPNQGTTTNGNIVPVRLDSFHRFYNIIGNVLGVQGVNTNYSGLIYSLGGGNGLASDPNVVRTLMRWGNYDAANGSNQFNPAEVPSGITNFANAVPVSQTLPASFYLSSKPSWWGTMPFPAIGPDVTGGNLPNLAGHVYMNPSYYCYANIMGGPVNGTGAVLTFNAASCYGVGSLPAPPAGLAAIVH